MAPGPEQNCRWSWFLATHGVRFPDSVISTATVGFDGTTPAVGALDWAVAEANRRDGAVQAVIAWCEGDYGGLGGPVAIPSGRASLVGPLASFRWLLIG